LRVGPIKFPGGLSAGYERKKQAKDYTKAFGLSKWKDGIGVMKVVEGEDLVGKNRNLVVVMMNLRCHLTFKIEMYEP
jgi:hypothetical protein